MAGVDVETQAGQLDAYEKEAEEVKRINKGTIGSTIEGLSEKMQAFKFEKFLDKLKKEGIDVSQITDEASIPEEKRAEYEEFKLSDELINSSPYADAKNKVIQTLVERDNKLNELVGNKEEGRKGKVQELLDNATSKKSEIEEKLQNSELKDEERKELEEQLGTLDNIIGRIGNTEQGLIADCEISKKATQNTKKEAIKILANQVEPYALNGRNVVYNDKDITNSLGKYDKEKDFLNNVSSIKKEMKDIENKEQEEKQNEEKEQSVEENKNQAQAQKGDKQEQAKGDASQPQAKVTTSKTLEDMIEETRNSLPLVYKIGYNEKNAMNYANATALLGSFTNNYSLNDQERLEMLNDPESKKILLNALKVAGDNLSPRKAKLFDDVREKIIDMSNGSLKQKALETIGITDPEDIKYEFNKAIKNYNEHKNTLNEILESKHSSAEAKEEAKNELEKLEKDYESIRNVADFSKSVGHIKTMKSRLKGFTKSMTNYKSTYKNLYNSFKRNIGNAFKSTKNWLNAPEKDYDADNRLDRNKKIRESIAPEPTVGNPEDEFSKSLQGSTYDQKEQAENTQKREEKEQVEQTMSRTQKNQKLYEDIQKDNVDGPSI